MIRKMTEQDTEIVFEMMRDFYDSPALIHKSSDKVLLRDIKDCLDVDNDLVEAFVFEDDDTCLGYAIISKNYTTEYGGLCIWIEDLYLRPLYRHLGISKQFFAYLEKRYKDAVRFKLEVEKENVNAVNAYKKNGYEVSDYFLMTKEIDKDQQ